MLRNKTYDEEVCQNGHRVKPESGYDVTYVVRRPADVMTINLNGNLSETCGRTGVDGVQHD